MSISYTRSRSGNLIYPFEMQKQIAFYLLLLLIPTNGEDIANGRVNVTDVKTNKEVQDMGRFAIDQYNLSLRQKAVGSTQEGVRGSMNRSLVFIEVVKAQKQTVAGEMYYLQIAAEQGSVTKNFESEVLSQPWEHSNPRQLLKFVPCPKN